MPHAFAEVAKAAYRYSNTHTDECKMGMRRGVAVETVKFKIYTVCNAHRELGL